MKQCKKCSNQLPMTEFYKHSAMADGHLNICKACTRKRVTAHRDANVERVREYDRQRAKFPATRQRMNTYVKRYNQEHKERYKAKNAVNNALRDGKLHKLPCFECGSVKVEAHHPSYDLPLDVVWLCPVHHKAIHHMRG